MLVRTVVELWRIGGDPQPLLGVGQHQARIVLLWSEGSKVDRTHTQGGPWSMLRGRGLHYS